MHHAVMFPGAMDKEPHRSAARGFSFLAPKVTPPRRDRGVVDRPRLVDLAAQIETRLLTSVKAPLGFGKTTLALAWADTLKERGGQIAWMSLDPEDDDPERFLHYMRQALSRAGDAAGSGSFSSASGSPSIQAHDFLTILINEISDFGDELFLFIDDYHCISHMAVHDHIAFLLRHGPSNFHLILMSRGDLPFSLNSLRVHDQILELDAAQLRFTPAETETFMRRTGAEPGAASAIHAMTQGWAAALRIAALSRMAGPPGSLASAPRSGVLRSLDALLSELLDQLPSRQVDFIEKTSIAERLCAPLCEALSGHANSQAELEALEAQQLLLTRLTDDNVWFGYHQLFRELLLLRLERRSKDVVAGQHRRACRWYAGQSLWTEAVKHALAAGDTDQALLWIEECAMPLVKCGDLFTLLGWERQLQASLTGQPVKLRLAIAWARTLGAPGAGNWQFLDAIEAAVSQEAPEKADEFLWECRAIRSVMFALADDPESAYPLASECLRQPSPDPWMTNGLYNVVRLCHLKAHRWPDFFATPVVPYSGDEIFRNVFVSIYRLALLGLGEFTQLQTASAERHLLEGMQLAETHVGIRSIPVAVPACLLALIRYEQLRLDEALLLSEGRLDIVPFTGFLDAMLHAFYVNAHIALRRGQSERAHALLERAEMLGVAHGWKRLEAAALLERMRLYLSQGRQAEALACLKRIGQTQTTGPAPSDWAPVEMRRYEKLANAHYALANGRFRDAASLFEPLYREALDLGERLSGMRSGTALAIALMLADDSGAAVTVFGEVVSMAAPAGIMASLLDQGPEVAMLIARLREQRPAACEPHAAFLDTLAAACLSHEGREGFPDDAHAQCKAITRRESRILELIAEGKSNKDIARAMGITPETVKSHLKNIFAKLSVGKRAQAVMRAEALGLIRSYRRHTWPG